MKKQIKKYLLLGAIFVSTNIYAAGTAGLTGVYTGDYQITVRAHPTGNVLGYGVRSVPWTWDFDKKEVVITGTTLSVGFNYAFHDIDNADPDNDIINFVDNTDGTYTIFPQFQIYKPDLGNPRANTTITFEIIKTDNNLEINTIDAEDGVLDGILGTQIPGVFPLTIEPAPMGTARLVGADSNNDGISDEDAIRLGLDPLKLDSDGDGINDIDEIGDINNPKDSDGDGIIDALEAGDLAFSSNSIEDIKLLNDSTISISVEESMNLQNVSVESMQEEIPDNTGIEDLIEDDLTLGEPGLEYSLGNLTFTTVLNDSSKDSTTVTLKLSSSLPEKLLIYMKEYESQVYSLLDSNKWEKVDDNTIKITISDLDDKDLDGLKNNEIKTSLAIAQNTLGQIERKDESAGGSIYSLLLLLSLIFLQKKFMKRKI